MKKFLPTVGAAVLLATAQTSCGGEIVDAGLARDIMGELVAINTAPSGGSDTSKAVALLVERLEQAGFDDSEIHALGQTEALQNLVVRYPGRDSDRAPLLLMAHLDVVDLSAVGVRKQVLHHRPGGPDVAERLGHADIDIEA